MSGYALRRLPFFVYGTLIPGQANDYFWQGAIRSVETAVLKNGKLYDMGFYPMMVEGKGGIVQGKLVTVADGRYDEVLRRIDDLEGYNALQPDDSTYRRITKEVNTGSGKRILSWTYAGRPKLAGGGKLIASGDWVAHTAHKHQEIDRWWISVTTVAGLHDDVQDD